MLRTLLVLASFALLPHTTLEAEVLIATPTITKTGTCPGMMTFTVTGASPSAMVAAAWGGAGTTIKTNNPCLGMTINVSNPQLIIVRQASIGGIMVFGGNVPPAVCGQFVVAVDLSNCTSSAPLVI